MSAAEYNARVVFLAQRAALELVADEVVREPLLERNSL
jgi:hypothetical protein